MASAALPLPARWPQLGAIPREEWRQLANWLLVWVLIANAGFMLMWIIGAPPRHFAILVTGTIGLIVRNQRTAIRIAAFIGAMGYSLISFLSGLFNLSITSMLYSVKFFLELDPAQSREYMLGAGIVAVLIGFACFIMRRKQGFSTTPALLAAIAAVCTLSLTDYAVGQGMRGHYFRDDAGAAAFTSAVSQTGFDAQPAVASAPKRHLMIVMVESLGQPVGNKTMDALLFARYRNPAVADRFTLSQGTTTYFNSTTAGEVRELCGRRGEYYDLVDRADPSCLPARLKARGFETTAYHSFDGAFFDRDSWYPNIGFDTRQFADDLSAQGLRPCGGVFPGVCDRDVPSVLAQKLKQAEKPQFIYWLTVNSHLPVPPGLNLDVERCNRLWPQLASDFPMICRQFAIWDGIDAALIDQITAADFPPTDILIVGDHMPPFFDRHHRRQFAPDRVPWLLLRWRDAPQTKDI